MRLCVSAAAAALAVGLAAPAVAAEPLSDDVAQLRVAPEHHAGYDRDKFGDYDRDAALARNFQAWPGCDGYFSRYDGQCYEVGGGVTKEEADDEVDIDHLVALAEAWESGGYRWGEARRDQFAADMANLNVMTDNLNSSKGSDDVTGWLPPRESQTCHFVNVVVDVKLAYNLAVDAEEKAKLTQLAAECDTGLEAPNDNGDDGGNGGDRPKDDGDHGDKTDRPEDDNEENNNHAPGGDGEEPVKKAPRPEPVENNLAVTG